MEKQKYNVKYVVKYHYWDNNENITEYDLGITYAKSVKQAINQVRYRVGIYPSDLGEFYIRDGYKLTYLEAKIIQ